jgi:hypothetical protein
MKQFHSELIALQNQLQQRGKTLNEIQLRLPHSEALNEIIQTLSGLADMQFSSIAQQWQIDPFQLATAASQITSKFITLLDYLHLVEEVEEPLLIQLFEELIGELTPWQCFYFILTEIKTVSNAVKTLFFRTQQYANLHVSKSEGDNQSPVYQDQIRNYEDQIYQIFQAFQDLLRGSMSR